MTNEIFFTEFSPTFLCVSTYETSTTVIVTMLAGDGSCNGNVTMAVMRYYCPILTG